MIPSVRRATQSDLISMAEIEQRASIHPWSMGHFRDSIDNHQCWLLAAESEPIGCLVFSQLFDEAELLNLVVEPRFQGRGHGRQLLEFFIDSNRLRARQLFLEVRVGNARAIKLYESVGFFSQGVRKGYYPAGKGREDALVMGYRYA